MQGKSLYFDVDILPEEPETINKWWEKRRGKYNKGLVVSGIIAFIMYAVLGSILIAPHVMAGGEDDFEITIFTIAFQGIGYLVMIGIANLFYNLGPFVDKCLNKSGSERFRLRLFNLGYWFSCLLPFLVPLLIVVEYFVLYA